MSSMAYNAAAGLGGMTKEGTQHFEQDGSASVVLRNIEACMELSRMLRTSLGPQGRCKLVVNHLEKRIVTSDCACILKEIEVQHPAAQLLKQACEKQETQVGDGTNLVVAFGGELLWQTCLLIQKMTWQPAPEILAGYQRALDLCMERVQKLVIAGDERSSVDRETLLYVLKPVLASKQYGSQQVLAPIVADACLQVRSDTKISAESVRTCKILGGSISDSVLLPGYVATRGVETTVTQLDNVKIAVFACGFEASSTEAKGTVLMKTADDLLSYNKTEERNMQNIVESIKESGVQFIVTGGNLSDMALHFLERNKMMALKISSKWELRRFCQAVGATALVRLGAPTPDEMGFCESVEQRELGGKTITLVRAAKGTNKLATIVLRASTSSVLNDLERAVDDGVQAVVQYSKDQRLVHGGGAVEMALSVFLQQEAEKIPGLEQYAVAAFGKALQIIPRTLSENAGWDATCILADLQAAHANNMDGSCDAGVDIDKAVTSGMAGGVASMKEKGVVDILSTKISAMRLAVDAVITILKIDQIIMSKPSGGPKQ
jgi:T-complex protein 1 subunit theta